MTISEDDYEFPEPVSATCDASKLVVTLSDRRVVSAPLWWYPRLFNASADQREKLELSPFGIHWPEIDEDISVEGLLKGSKHPKAYLNLRDRLASSPLRKTQQKINFAVGEAAIDSLGHSEYTFEDFKEHVASAA